MNGRWIFRFPRRPEVEEWLAKEIALLPELAPVLPIAIPRPELVARNGVRCVGYRKIEGTPVNEHVAKPYASALADELGAFLVALHSFPVERARGLGVPSHDTVSWRRGHQELCEDLRLRVCPLLEPPERRRAVAVFEHFLDDDANFDFEPTLLHADLGPEHILCGRASVTGVIDWSDTRIGDPALDLAWLLCGTPPAFADRVHERYARVADPTLRARALFYHRLGPWYEVAYGLDGSRPELVRSGLDGIRSRLPRPLPYER